MTDLRQNRQRRRFGVGRIILVALGGLAVFGVALFLILRTALGPMVEAGDAFMGGLGDGNDAEVYAQAAPELKQALGSAARLSATVGAYRPVRWSWSTRSIRNAVGELRGNVTYRGGNSGTSQLRLTRVDGQWRVTAF